MTIKITVKNLDAPDNEMLVEEYHGESVAKLHYVPEGADSHVNVFIVGDDDDAIDKVREALGFDKM
jgi:predicted dinucleotide-binding enzyme